MNLKNHVQRTVVVAATTAAVTLGAAGAAHAGVIIHDGTGQPSPHAGDFPPGPYATGIIIHDGTGEVGRFAADFPPGPYGTGVIIHDGTGEVGRFAADYPPGPYGTGVIINDGTGQRTSGTPDQAASVVHPHSAIIPCL